MGALTRRRPRMLVPATGHEDLRVLTRRKPHMLVPATCHEHCRPIGSGRTSKTEPRALARFALVMFITISHVRCVCTAACCSFKACIMLPDVVCREKFIIRGWDGYGSYFLRWVDEHYARMIIESLECVQYKWAPGSPTQNLTEVKTAQLCWVGVSVTERIRNS